MPKVNGYAQQFFEQHPNVLIIKHCVVPHNGAICKFANCTIHQIAPEERQLFFNYYNSQFDNSVSINYKTMRNIIQAYFEQRDRELQNIENRKNFNEVCVVSSKTAQTLADFDKTYASIAQADGYSELLSHPLLTNELKEPLPKLNDLFDFDNLVLPPLPPAVPQLREYSQEQLYRYVHEEILNREPVLLKNYLQEAKSYKSLAEWETAHVDNSQRARAHLWTSYIDSKIKDVPYGYHHCDLGMCFDQAQLYSNMKDWARYHTGTFQVATENHYLPICCAHMQEFKVPYSYWTVENCVANANSFNSIDAWIKYSPDAYLQASMQGWLGACLRKKIKINKDWRKKDVSLQFFQEQASRYGNLINWYQRSKASFRQAVHFGYIDQCVPFLNIVPQPRNLITLDMCREDAKNYPDKFTWQIYSGANYQVALKNFWLDDCCQYFKK